jgi:transcriptional regulator with XRE-family HTH domain
MPSGKGEEMANQPEAELRAIGLVLRSLRDLRGMDGPDVAERLGWSANKLYRLERGEATRPTLFELEALAAAYGFTLDEVREIAAPIVPVAARSIGNKACYFETPDDLLVWLETPPNESMVPVTAGASS